MRWFDLLCCLVCLGFVDWVCLGWGLVCLLFGGFSTRCLDCACSFIYRFCSSFWWIITLDCLLWFWVWFCGWLMISVRGLGLLSGFSGFRGNLLTDRG